MKTLFVHYPKCSTCQKAKLWLEDHGIPFECRDIKVNRPTEKELTQWIIKSGLPIKRFFNTSGLVYKELECAKKLPHMSEEAQIQLLATNGMLVKRPIVVTTDKVLVGFKEKEWTEAWKF